MSDLESLYKELIFEHSQNPHNFGAMPHPDKTSNGYNPVCGDRICLGLKMISSPADIRLDDIKFEGEGCAICMASASIMTDEVKGKTVSEVQSLVQALRSNLRGEELEVDSGTGKSVVLEGDIEALLGVRRFPVRIKCALLPWMTLKDALEGEKS